MERNAETDYLAQSMGRRRYEPGGFPAEFLALRGQLGTQLEAAMLLGMTPQSISRYERGEMVPHPVTQKALLDTMRAELKKRARRKPPAG